MFVPVLLAACWYYPSTRVCLLLQLDTAHYTVHTAKCTVHTALRDAWCQNSKFCNKGRHSMNWRDRRESVNNAKSASSYFFWLQYFVCKHFHLCCSEGVPCRLRRLVFFQIIPVFTLLPFFRTRSYAAPRSADLDWIVGPGYTSGGSILECTQRFASCLIFPF